MIARPSCHPSVGHSSVGHLSFGQRSRPVLALAVTVALVAGAVPASVGAAAESPPPPGAVSIEADQGIEWQRGALLVIARGNAKAVRDDGTVQADVLTAHYREGPDGSSKVWKIDADGGVRLTMPDRSAFGDQGTYDVESGTLVLTGKKVGLSTATNKITADKELEYDSKTRILVATGNAVVVDGDRTVYGDVVTIHLRQDATGKTQPARLEANGHVRVVTPKDDIRADRGTYDVDRDFATVDGAVRIVQGANQLEGCHGEMDMRAGISRLSACPGGSTGGSRVQGLIVPKPKQAP